MRAEIVDQAIAKLSPLIRYGFRPGNVGEPGGYAVVVYHAFARQAFVVRHDGDERRFLEACDVLASQCRAAFDRWAADDPIFHLLIADD